MQVKALYIKEEKKGKVKKIPKGFFQKDKGLMGDVKSQGGEKQVSIITSEGMEQIKSIQGLCTNRFYANIEIHGLDMDKLYRGQRLKIGNTLQEITILGKECFRECNLYKSGPICPLPSNVFFTKVIEEGIIEVGHRVDIQK
ncbi:MAG: MOSC domain-containing protein [Tissierellia bacterium]|nr:MOSC domain-containing protein [Tissierellia bacterium]